VVEQRADRVAGAGGGSVEVVVGDAVEHTGQLAGGGVQVEHAVVLLGQRVSREG
jgi:hypothetical protein